MALFEDESAQAEITFIKSGNSYLDNPKKGLALLKKILSSDTKSESAENQKLIAEINEKIIPVLAQAKIDGELSMAHEINRLKAKLDGSYAYEALSTKQVVGIGGRFSSGKSSFINSLVSKSSLLLPEGQNPTTSISTYITGGNTRKNIVSTKRGADIEIDDEAVIALNHQFYEQYGIGFSKYINNIILETPLLTYKSIALLDTPGYNKSDSNKKQEASDKEKSKTQLQTVDRLIWLADSDSVIKSQDIIFLQMLAPEYPVLFVMNKADKRSKSALEQIINSSKESLDNAGIDYYDVVGYSSFDGKEILSEGVIGNYLSEIDLFGSQHISGIAENVAEISGNIRRQLSAQLSDINLNRDFYREMILKNNDLFNIGSVINAFNQDNIYAAEVNNMLGKISEINTVSAGEH